MHETLRLLETLEPLRARGEETALATVVRTAGSTFRKESAKLLITAAGDMVGSISAGCLENDVREAAGEVLHTGDPQLLHYDNTAPEDIIWGLGLGCNGVVDVFVEAIDYPGDASERSDISLYEALSLPFEEDHPAALARIIANDSNEDPRPGKRMVLWADGGTRGGLGDANLERRVRADALAFLKRERSGTVTYKLAAGSVDVYIEALLPPAPLVILGADPDARPIVSAAKALGFRVIVVDHRETHANGTHYPDADEVVVCEPEDLVERAPLTERSWVLIKTHNYLRDKALLATVLKSPVRYVGQLGPKARTEDLLADLAREGVRFSDAELARLYAPVGLDLGAESPEEIAVSILGEMLAIKYGREGRFLRNQTASIHPR